MRLPLAALLLATILHAAAPRPDIEVVSTDRVEFAPGGTIRIEGSTGELNIDAWDEPRVEIVVTRTLYPLHDTATERDAATRELNDLHVSATKSGEKQLTISTPRLRRCSKIQVDYRIRVPRATSLVIRHGTGDILIAGVEGDTDAAIRFGDILLRLPTGDYAFDADSREGGIRSEFPGAYQHARLTGSRFTATATGHRQRLHAGIGGIVIQRLPE